MKCNISNAQLKDGVGILNNLEWRKKGRKDHREKEREQAFLYF